jgi:excisionase family DNA binding protein
MSTIDETLDPRIESIAAHDAAWRLGMKGSTVRKWCIRGVIPAVKRGTKWYISRETYNKLRDEGTDAFTPSAPLPPAPVVEPIAFPADRRF